MVIRKMIQYLNAKEISYAGTRPLEKVTAIAIHYTGNIADTAQSNVIFFARNNTRQAGAHIFVDAKEFIQSIPLKRIAYAVGKSNGTYSNSNTVSIEIADSNNGVSTEQLKHVKEAIAYVRTKCPNVKKLIRHYDVSGKECPRWAVRDEKAWKEFCKKITGNEKGDFK